MWLALGFISLVLVSVTDEVVGGIINARLKNLPTQPSVVIAQGTVVGSLATNGNYAEFYGIPYADATSGSNRFKAPNPAPLFQDPFLADRKDIKCVRALGAGFEGTEDCLVANIFTPTLDKSMQLPVMVWVKGKEFDRADKPELSFGNFVEKDVIVVTLNYRESILGFLCLGTEIAPGNAGLKDIIAGLKWVKENIEEFGGNADDITLVGHGSGAAAVDLVTMSPMSSGLVNKAIVQSGNALAPWAVSRDNLEYAIQVAEALGHRLTNIEDLSEIFKRTSVAALMGAINDLDLTDNSLAFAPCLERESLEGGDPFLVESPYNILQNGEFLRVPLIIGYVDNEGTIRSEEAIEDDWMSRMDESFNEFLQPDLKFENSEEQTEIAQRIRTQYFQNDPIDSDHVENYIDYHGDTMILVSTLREIRMRVAASNPSPVFMYQFSYKGALGEPFEGPLAVESAAHSEELAYMLFDSLDTNQVPVRDLAISNVLVERWTNFAKTAAPVSETSNTLWFPFTGMQSLYLRFLDSNEITSAANLDALEQNPNPETMTFWDQVYAEHFLDAEGKWELTDRIEDEDEDEEDEGEDNTDTGDGSGDEDSGEDNTDTGEGSGEGSEEDNGDDNDNDGDQTTDSASIATGYTFSIITLFAILNKFQSIQMLS